jgi:hypothetical protein
MVATDEPVVLRELVEATVAGGVVAEPEVLDRNQLNGDLLGGCGGGGAGATVAAAGAAAVESFLGGRLGAGADLLAFVATELAEDRENLFAMDSTNVDGVDTGGGGVSLATGGGSLDGGSSSIKDTSSRDEVDIRRVLIGDFVCVKLLS